MSHVNVLEVQNYMKVESFKVEPQGNHVIISAANDSGKSSVVNALYDGISGINSKEHPDPVRHGADKAVIRIKTEEYLIERQIKQDGKSSLVVKTHDGKKIAGMTPQKLLDGLISEYCLDPVQFLNRRPQDQIDDVLKVCGIVPPVDKVEAITGESCPALPNETADRYLERLSADNTGLYYIKRRQMNQEVDTCRGAVDKQEQLIASMNVPDEVVRPVENIMADLDRLNDEEKQRAEQLDALKELTDMQVEYEKRYKEIETDIVVAGRDRAALKNNVAMREGNIASYEKEIALLQDRIRNEREQIGIKNEEINKLQVTINGLTERLENGSGVIEEHKQLIAKQRELVDSLSDVSDKRKLLSEEMKKANQLQEGRVKHEATISRHNELVVAHEEAKRKHTQLDVCLERLRDLRRNLLNDVDLGIAGLSIGDGELLLNGVSFKQASSSQKLTVAFCIAIRGNPSLKLVRIDNGELLDHSSQQHLLSLASQHGYQVIMTRVSDQQGLQVEIVDR